MDKSKSCRILMIGNSYTYYNQLWDLFTGAASSVGCSVQVDHVTKGGYFLAQHADPSDICGAQIELLLSQNKYDFVFLQENSICPILDFDRFACGAKALGKKIQANGAKTVLYQTWARKYGSTTLAEHNWTVERMHAALETAYRRLGMELNADVSPVGSVFFRITKEHPEIELYDPDRTHPSLAGSYLAALCHLVTLTGDDPMSVPYNAGLDIITANTIKRCITVHINASENEVRVFRESDAEF